MTYQVKFYTLIIAGHIFLYPSRIPSWQHVWIKCPLLGHWFLSPWPGRLLPVSLIWQNHPSCSTIHRSHASEASRRIVMRGWERSEREPTRTVAGW